MKLVQVMGLDEFFESRQELCALSVSFTEDVTVEAILTCDNEEGRMEAFSFIASTPTKAIEGVLLKANQVCFSRSLEGK